MPTTHLNSTQAGAQITRDNFHWGTTLGAPAGPITFGFRQTTTANNTAAEKGTFSTFTAQEIAAAETSMHEWAAVANIKFTEVNPGAYTNNASILFANYRSTTDNSQAYSYFPTTNNQLATSSQGDVWLNTAYESTTNLAFGRYDFMTLIHEIGHALGLEHPGDYNAGPGQVITYANSALYVEDSRQYTVMSYFDASNTGANHVFNGQSVYASTPLLDDITAIQRLYGANMSYATGDTVYGFNSNADSAYHLNSATQQVVCCIWDAGGSDTLDFSGYSTNQLIDLIPGTFSNVGALTKNVSIALGAIIESAIGGSGSDTFFVNGAGNHIDGRAGTDTVVFTGAHTNYAVTQTPDGSIQVVDLRGASPDGTDTLVNVELLQFTDGVFSPNDVLSVSAQPWAGKSPVAIGHFNPDGTADVVWQDSSGQAVITLMDGATEIGSTTLRYSGATWHIIAASDFNGDGKADILWQNDNGLPSVWLMNGTAELDGAELRNSGPTWHLRGTADFNGDGKADILWQNDNGLPAVWLMDGTAEAGGANFRNSGPTWHVMATADFNGDGKADILWQNDDGHAAIWLMDGTSEIGGINLTDKGPTWHIRDAADFNGDGKADILWQNDGGQVVVELMNGTTELSSSTFQAAAPAASTSASSNTDSSVSAQMPAGQDQFIFASNASGGAANAVADVRDNPQPDLSPAPDPATIALASEPDYMPIAGQPGHPIDPLPHLLGGYHLV